MLESFFEDKLIDDDREAVLTFFLPYVEGTFALYPPKLIFWLQLLVVSPPRSKCKYLFLGNKEVILPFIS